MLSLISLKDSLAKAFKANNDLWLFVILCSQVEISYKNPYVTAETKAVTWSHCHFFGVWWWNGHVQVHQSFSLQLWIVITVKLLFISSVAGKLYYSLLCPGYPTQPLRGLTELFPHGNLCKEGTGPCSQSPTVGRGHALSKGKVPSTP